MAGISSSRRRDAQPRYQAAGRVGVVRFDGKDDHLELLGPGRLLDDFTIFLVVAPRSNPGGFSAFLAGQPAGWTRLRRRVQSRPGAVGLNPLRDAQPRRTRILRSLGPS